MDTGPVAMGGACAGWAVLRLSHGDAKGMGRFTYPQSGMECGADLWEFAEVHGPFRGNGAA